MKQIIRTGGGGSRIPTKDEVKVAEILLNLPKLCVKSEFASITRYNFTWGRKKRRSAMDLKSEPLQLPSTQKPAGDGTAEEAKKSPSTPLSFLPSGSGSDGGDCRKPPKIVKRKATDDLMEIYSRMQQEREILIKNIRAMETHRQELTSENLELKAKEQKLKYPRNMEDFHKWNNCTKTVDQQHFHHQITMFAPSKQQLMVHPNNGKLVIVSCSSDSNGDGRFGLFNQIDPRVKIHKGHYDFMATSHPLDQRKYLMDSDLRVMNAAAARKRRILRMKENKKSLVAMKVSRACR